MTTKKIYIICIYRYIISISNFCVVSGNVLEFPYLQGKISLENLKKVFSLNSVSAVSLFEHQPRQTDSMGENAHCPVDIHT